MDRIRINARDILEGAVRIEETGEKFYRGQAEKVEEPQVKNLFSHLAEQEAQHRETFSRMLADIKTGETSLSGSYFSYLTDQVVFPSMVDRELPEELDTAAALDFAIKRELDSMLYYMEIKRAVVSSQQDVIDRIVDEERKHFTDLSELKARLFPSGQRAEQR